MPRVIVRPNPGKHTEGIRYYRPKPYLLITPYEEAVTTFDDKGNPVKKVTGLSHQYVSLKLEYLPDFSEEYAIKIRSGLGINNTTITLQDGWNLTSINEQLDSQTDENIQAVAKLLESAGSLAKGVHGESTAPPSAPVPHVRATNVPIGYYESVIGMHGGKKRLYGWRYVGFFPFAQCPLDMGGVEFNCCDGADVYGLVFDKVGENEKAEFVMTFRCLGRLRGEADCMTIEEIPCEPIPNGKGIQGAGT